MGVALSEGSPAVSSVIYTDHARCRRRCSWPWDGIGRSESILQPCKIDELRICGGRRGVWRGSLLHGSDYSTECGRLSGNKRVQRLVVLEPASCCGLIGGDGDQIVASPVAAAAAHLIQFVAVQVGEPVAGAAEDVAHNLAEIGSALVQWRVEPAR